MKYKNTKYAEENAEFNLASASAVPVLAALEGSQSFAPDALSGVFVRLKEQGVDAGYIEDFISVAASRFSFNETPDRMFARWLSTRTTFSALLPHEHKVVALIGPAGAGRTSTMVKLAERLRTAFGIKIALVSVENDHAHSSSREEDRQPLHRFDRRRIKAGCRLSATLKRVLRSLDDFDLILIDTPAVDLTSAAALKIDRVLNSILGLDNVEPVLVLSAGDKKGLAACGSINREIERCRRVVINGLDQYGYFGGVINMLLRSELVATFFGTGSRIPEDIEPATALRLAQMVMRIVN